MTFLWEMYRSNEQHGICCFPYERGKSTISYTFPSDDNIHQLQNTEMSGARNTIISLQSELWILRQMRGELVVRR